MVLYSLMAERISPPPRGLLTQINCSADDPRSLRSTPVSHPVMRPVQVFGEVVEILQRPDRRARRIARVDALVMASEAMGLIQIPAALRILRPCGQRGHRDGGE